ncbi:hypothetical protein [Paenibacillus sp. GYB003]|uniref:hypothetical protein n=1 Tax=Paenibacillus sp. GYB003 TaxID=2994392 RepID=UPI002F9616DC
MVSISQLAESLGKSVRTIQHWVASGVARPINLDTYRRDGGYTFSADEAERLSKLFGGLGAKEAAEIVGVTPQYLNELALSGHIPSELRKVGKRERRFYKKEDCFVLRDQLHTDINKKTSKFGAKLTPFSNGWRIFEYIEHEGKKGLISNTRPLIITGEDGRSYKITCAGEMSPWPERKYQVQKGFVDFRFPIPRAIVHPVYDLLRALLENLGSKNIQIFETKQGDYFVRCRSGSLRFSDVTFDLLQKNVVNGILEKSRDTILLRPDAVVRYVSFTKAAFEIVKRAADDSNMGFDEALNMIIISRKISDDLT